MQAYRNFGSRVKSLKRKLDELIPTLASPVPSPDVNAPSPSPDSDIDLPNDEDLSGIVECLEDFGDKVIESESEDDLMSVYSYYSSDDENSVFTHYDWKNMSSHMRRQYLPVPRPEFSDSDLTELDDSFEEVEEPSITCLKNAENCFAANVLLCSKNSEYGKSNNLVSQERNSVKPCQTECSIGVVFKEPEHRKISHSSSDKKIKSIKDAGCPLINDALSLSRGDAHICLDDINEGGSLPTDVQEKEIWTNIDSASSVSKGAFVDIGGDFLPTDDDLSGLLECLQDDFIDTAYENPSASSSPVAKKRER